MKRLVLDLDDTLTKSDPSLDYADKAPNTEVIEKVREYKAEGYEIIVYTARNMRTYGGSVGKITANTLPVIIEWLRRNGVPYDEIHVGKPWCGFDGFYVDDRAIRPSEFVSMTTDEIAQLIKKG